MKTLTSTDAKARFNAVLAELESTGEPVTITSHGRPVALISPVQPSRRTFGQFPNLTVPDSFDEPLSPGELAGWVPAP